jgi:ABC-type proline/glycine betaine transport system permease subunit
MELCILAFGFALMVGIPVGMLAGITRNKWQDKLISALALLGFSVPVFWLALLLTLFFSLTLGWLPVSGRFDLLYNVKTVTGFAIIDAWLSDSMWRHEMIVSAVRHMVLPVLTLAVAPTTEVIRLMRISTIEVFDQNYVKAAATRGLSRLTILRRHVLHNALPPVIPRLGLQFSTMLTLAMITEMVFSWPGLGRWLINAIRQQDYAAYPLSRGAREKRQLRAVPSPLRGEGQGERCYLRTALQQHRLNMADSARRVQPLRTYTDAVHNAMAAEYAESIAQPFQSAVGFGIAAVNQEAIRGQQASRAHKLVWIPPERRARGRAACTKNTLIQAIEFFTLLWRL